MNNKPILIDGATGTCLWSRIGDNSPVWQYNLEKPEEVLKLHKDYIDAGARLICANTFGANSVSLEKSEFNVESVVREGVSIAKQAAFGRDVTVALDIGTLPILIEPYGDLSEEEAEEIFHLQIGSGMKESPDVILLQTFIDVATLRIAAKVARQFEVPLFCSMSFEQKGRSMMGDSPLSMIEGLSEFAPDVIGLNCALEPASLLPILDVFVQNTDSPLFFKPNAGKPSYEMQNATVDMGADEFATEMMGIPTNRKIYVGGCCGTTPEYIAAMHKNLINH